MSEQKPPALAVIADNIPRRLATGKRFVLWRWELREGKWTKPPYQPNGQLASVDDPYTWCTFAVALDAYATGEFDGIGRTAEDGIVAIDQDRCVDVESGAIGSEERARVDLLDSYTEISPSGTGLHTFAWGRLPDGGRRKGNLELYDSGRYLTLTGHRVDGEWRKEPLRAAVMDRPEQILELYRQVFGVNGNGAARPKPRTPSSALTAYEIVKLAEQHGSADKWARLMRGDLSEYGGDDSRADSALCSLAAFYTDDPGAIDQIVRMSGLCRPKWTERPDYRERTIRGALELVTDRYGAPTRGQIRHSTSRTDGGAADGSDKPYALALDDFIALQLDTRPPLIGTEDDNILPAGGLLILVAKGGKGKTTLTIEMALHGASGVDWLGFRIERPLRILIIENEGPIKPFQRKLARRRKRWEHEIAGAVFIKYLDWGAFRIDGDGQAQRLRAFIEQEHIDLVVGDPLGSLGLKGVGSPEDTRELMARLVETGLTRDVAFWLLHHPRKEAADDEIDEASGDWQGKPDTMLKLGLLPGNRSRLSFPKVRWGAVGSRSAYILAFDSESEAFSLAGREAEDERDLVAEIRALFADGGWRTAKEISAPKRPKDGSAPGIGANLDAIREALTGRPDEFISRNGKELGRSALANLWNLSSGTHQLTDSEVPSQLSQLVTQGGEKEGTDSPTRPYIGVGRSESVHSLVSERSDLTSDGLSQLARKRCPDGYVCNRPADGSYECCGHPAEVDA